MWVIGDESNAEERKSRSTATIALSEWRRSETAFRGRAQIHAMTAFRVNAASLRAREILACSCCMIETSYKHYARQSYTACASFLSYRQCTMRN